MTQQNPLAEIFDTFFNGRPAPKPTPFTNTETVTLMALVARRKSHVRINGKLYRIEVTEIQEKGK